MNKRPPYGLFVAGISHLAMPMTEAQTKQLIEKAHQAPFGKGSEILVDTSVRDMWELDTSQFSFKTPLFKLYVRDVCKSIAIHLGINGTINAELYKMRICGKGAMFKPHTE